MFIMFFEGGGGHCKKAAASTVCLTGFPCLTILSLWIRRPLLFCHFMSCGFVCITGYVQAIFFLVVSSLRCLWCSFSVFYIVGMPPKRSKLLRTSSSKAVAVAAAGESPRKSSRRPVQQSSTDNVGTSSISPFTKTHVSHPGLWTSWFPRP